MSALSTRKSFQSLSTIFHTWASSFLFANGKVPRTQIEQKKPPGACSGKMWQDWQVPALYESTFWVCSVIFWHFIWVNIPSIWAPYINDICCVARQRFSQKSLDQVSFGQPHGSRYRCVFCIQESNTQILCEAQNVSRKCVIRTLSNYVLSEFKEMLDDVGSACSSSLDLYGSREWPPCWSKEYSQY